VQDKAILDESCCVECGLCVSRCRPGALIWAQPV
jgi:NAD-dependent dihydropyrimidine dehydrogenase PreA subunit